jgi:uncharacterized protein (DUF2236 family)
VAIAVDTQELRPGINGRAGRHEDATGALDDSVDGAGLYGRHSQAWLLNREAMLLLGAGPRSLLLQIAHPLIAEGVDQHSDFRVDPWARLTATVRSYLTIVYGTARQARAEIARLNRLHRSIVGPVRDPEAGAITGARAYSARDPELSLWVHATLVDSTIVTYDAWIEPLSRERRAACYEECKPIGRAFGIPDDLLPADLAAFERYLERMMGPGGIVTVTPAARELAQTILHPSLAPLAPPLAPILHRIPAEAYDWALWPSIALLPESIREGYRIPWTPVNRLVAGWLLAAWRAWRPLLPRSVRWFSAASEAFERSAGQ